MDLFEKKSYLFGQMMIDIWYNWEQHVNGMSVDQ